VTQGAEAMCAQGSLQSVLQSSVELMGLVYGDWNGSFGYAEKGRETETVMSLSVETRAEESSAREVEEAKSSPAYMKADSALATGE
jgi:hypothetical protein